MTRPPTNAALQDVKVKDATSSEASLGAVPLDASLPVGAAPHVMQQNTDGTYSQAIPEPFFLAFGRKMCCECWEKFWFDKSYRKHYEKQHTDGKRYVRSK